MCESTLSTLGQGVTFARIYFGGTSVKEEKANQIFKLKWWLITFRVLLFCFFLVYAVLQNSAEFKSRIKSLLCCIQTNHDTE